MSFSTTDLGAYAVLRLYVKVEGDRKVRLSGYGVELAIKSTEYKAQDDSKQAEDTDHEPLEGEVSGFNFTKLGVKYPELKKELQAYKNALSETSNELKPLKVWQMQDLSYQAAQKAVDSGDAPLAQLEVLKDISQNFPSLTSSLVNVQMRDSFRKSVKKTQRALDQYGVAAGDSALLINGITMDIDTVDMFSLYDVIRGDLTIMDQLSTHGLVNEDIGNILKHLTNSKDQQFALDIRDSAIVYINDLERDEIYSQWPRTLRALLQPTFPGMMRHLSRNLFNLVMIFDVIDVNSGIPLELLASLYSHQAPIRIGFVPVAKEDDEVGVLLSQVFFKMVDEKDGVEAVLALAQFYQKMTSSETSVISVEDVAEEFKKLVGDLDEVREDDDYINSRAQAYHFYERSGLAEMPVYLLNGVPIEGLTADSMDEVIVGEVLKATPTFQRAVYHGKLTDDMDPLEWLMMQDHVMPRLNARVLNTDNKCVSMDKDSGVALDSLKYLYKGADDVMRDTTMLVVGDLGSASGRQLLLEAITHMKTTKKVRVGVIHNQVEESMYSKAIQLALEILGADEARTFITKLLKLTKDTLDVNDVESLAVTGMDAKAFSDRLRGYKFDFANHGAFSRSKLMLACGQRAVISNGRVVGPLEDREQFTTDDFALLERYGGAGETVVKVSKIVKKMGLEPAKASDVMSLVLGTLACTSSEKSRKDIKLDDGGESMITIAADTSEPAFDIVAVVEPLSRGAQKILPILLTLQKVVNCEVKVYLNCKDKLSELPLKSYYRYVLDPHIRFNVVGGLASGPEAYFDSLPHKSILTLNVQPPEGWLVESVSAVHDLDNIKLEQVKTGVDAGYELEYLLLEGHCYESDSGQPPRGLQLLLGKDNSPDSATADTLVMANLGYFQLKANPGAWHLMIRPGRSAEIYSITSHEHTDSPSKSEDVVVVMDTFKSKIINMKVAKRVGKEGEDLLADKGEDEGEEQGLWGSISSSLGGGSGSADEDKDEYLNIFSLASGHLYERLMRIMILSIVKQTKSPVKFWLLKNYLSPEFKDFIPVMAKEYGFKYELVQYKWPRWLNQQTEKQRVMWGYKILFLDVLFPLGVKKIAFIDADQTVRTDIQELFDLDLGGAPYGYTPFCNSRKEMDGFRFWMSGYWKQHLGSRPYHISALYVIDLKRFRKIAAGDRLRGQYQALSQDPNSLSNLDQDLPNNMIHQVKIKSLPQEWLWCETWCSDESKPKAKTIDLCNNPLTKEPKLDAARRIVPEWIDYDSEIKTLWDGWQATRPVKETLDGSESTTASHSHTEL